MNFTVTSAFTMKRLRLANALGARPDVRFTVSRCSPRLSRNGRFDEAIALYKRSESLSGRRADWSGDHLCPMNRRKEARQMLEAAIANRFYTAGRYPGPVHVVWENMTTRFANWSMRVKNIHRRCTL